MKECQWNGKQVISKAWCEKITAPYSTFEEVNPSGSGYFNYGYMWWIFDVQYYKDNPAYEGAYMARGAGGQFILVMPKLDLVVAWKTVTSNNKSTNFSQFRTAMKYLLEAYKGELTIGNSDPEDKYDNYLD